MLTICVGACRYVRDVNMNGVFTQSVGMKPMQDRLNWMQRKGSRRAFGNSLGALGM